LTEQGKKELIQISKTAVANASQASFSGGDFAY
jgi:hypothetical protein